MEEKQENLPNQPQPNPQPEKKEAVPQIKEEQLIEENKEEEIPKGKVEEQVDVRIKNLSITIEYSPCQIPNSSERLFKGKVDLLNRR